MLALDVNLKQSWRGEELLTLVTLVELHICEAQEGRARMALEGWTVSGQRAEVRANT